MQHTPNNQPTCVPLEKGAPAVEKCLAALGRDESATLMQGGKPIASLKFVAGDGEKEDCWELVLKAGDCEASLLSNATYPVYYTVNIGGEQIRLPDPTEVELGAEDSLSDAAPTEEYGTLPLDSSFSPELRSHLAQAPPNKDKFSGSFACGEYAAVTGIGLRDKNCDVARVITGLEERVSLVVLDGAYREGDVAAHWVGNFLEHSIANGKTGKEALQLAAPSLQQWTEESRPDLLPKKGLNERKYQMGTCAVLADINEGAVTFSHIGDCRGYLLRRDEEGHFYSVVRTQDHSWAEEVMQRDGCSRSALHPMVRNTVSRMILVGDPQGTDMSFDKVESSDTPLTLKSGDLVLLHSDGAHLLELNEILHLCNQGGTVGEIGERLQAELESAVHNRAAKREAADNYTLLLLEYRDPASLQGGYELLGI
jgi:serine/threonine protein phosphatase PrpC